MKNKYVLDTSFISSLFNEKDINHQLAKIKASEILEDSIVIIPSIVFVELSLFSSEVIIVNKLLDFALELSSNILDYNHRYLVKFRKTIKKLTFKITTIDSLIFFASIENKAELITLDKKLQQGYNFLIKI